MTRKPVALLAAVVLALVGTLLLTSYVRTAEDRATAGEDLVPVLVVTGDVEPGTKAEDLDSLVTTEKVPAKVVAEGAVSSLGALDGTVATVKLVAGDQLTTARFATIAASGRAAAPSGLLEVTIPLEPSRAMGGLLQPGEKVAVVITVDDQGNGTAATRLVLHKITVTGVQASTADDTGDTDVAPSNNLLVTLALDAPSLERVVFAAEKGHIWLAAQPDDAPEGGTSVQTQASVLR